MDAILRRRFSKLEYVCPEAVLRQVLPDVERIFRNDPAVAPRDRNVILEKYQAAFLGFMTQHIAGPMGQVDVALTGYAPDMQDEEFDCVIRGRLDGQVVYRPVQLKQLPPEEVDADITLQGMIDRFKKGFAKSPELIVGIWINRNIRLDFRTLNFADLHIGQLWIFGDSADGRNTLDGGVVSDLLNGLRFSGVMEHGRPRIKALRFR